MDLFQLPLSAPAYVGDDRCIPSPHSCRAMHARRQMPRTTETLPGTAHFEFAQK